MGTLNKDLKMPKFSFSSNCRPSLFAYPPKTKVSTSNAPAKVATAVLSTTRKAQDRKKLRASQAGDSMQIDPPKDEKEEKKDEPKEGEKKKKKKKKKKGKKKKKKKKKKKS